ncbi:MAG: tetratricopeptide repeat protein, partial [Verrucomicrobiales bacterium]|nr:tetratricopeptide repeat protein [Verrucomicrobiales bacterium]
MKSLPLRAPRSRSGTVLFGMHSLAALVASLLLLATTTRRSFGATRDTSTFHEHVAPLVFQHCASCHREGGVGPFSLLAYADARKHGREMAEMTARRAMPPWLPALGHGEFIGERHLSDEAIAVFQNWLKAGMPEGDPGKSPVPPKFSSDWELGPPDLVVRMAAPYTVPASGKDVYRHFVMPAKLDRRRWIRAWQFRPHSRAVHHIFVRLDRTGEARRRDAADPDPGFPGMDTPSGIESPVGHFTSWQPGANARQNPPGMPWALDPGTDLVVQMHLQPLGRPDPMQAEIGLYFTDVPPTNQPVKVALINFDIDLAPGATNVVLRDDFVLPTPAQLLAVLPHSHYLGRRIEGRAVFPDGRAQSVFLIPDWDFNWQGDYVYRTPIALPAGTRLEMAITFDNSTNNFRNPFLPPRRVRYGPNTVDEMAELWLLLLPNNAEDGTKLRQANAARVVRDVFAVNEQRLRLNPTDTAAMVNLGKALLSQRRFDDARRRFLEAAAQDSAFDEPHYYLGLLHRIAGQDAAAITEFQRALQLNPSHARAHGNLGLLLMSADRLEDAARHLGEALRLDPTDFLAMSNLGAIRLQQGRPADAIDLLTRALELQPNDPDTRRFLEIAREQVPGPLRPA